MLLAIVRIEVRRWFGEMRNSREVEELSMGETCLKRRGGNFQALNGVDSTLLIRGLGLLPPRRQLELCSSLPYLRKMPEGGTRSARLSAISVATAADSSRFESRRLLFGEFSAHL